MSCSAILNEYDGIRHDYTRKRGLVWEKVFLPESAPTAWQDRSVLWNAVEEAVEQGILRQDPSGKDAPAFPCQPPRDAESEPPVRAGHEGGGKRAIGHGGTSVRVDLALLYHNAGSRARGAEKNETAGRTLPLPGKGDHGNSIYF